MANVERSLQTINREMRAIKREMNYVSNTIIDYSKSDPTEITFNVMQAGLKQFSKSKQELNDIHKRVWELLEDCSADDATRIEEEILEERQNSLETLMNLEVLIAEVKQKIRLPVDSHETNTFTNTYTNNSLNASVAAAELPKLPKIAIPTFDGNIRKFGEYRDLFETLVHNNVTLAGIQKLYYLKNSLRGDATTALNSFDTKTDCYEAAWKFLCEQYENHRLVIQTHFNDFNNVSSIKTEKDLPQLIRSVDSIISSLKTCGINKETGWSPYVAFQIVNKLDNQTKRDWENSLGDNSPYPLYEDLYTFLKKRCNAIQNYNVSLNSVLSRPESSIRNWKEKLEQKKSFMSSAMSDNSNSLINLKSPSECIVCEQNHYLNQCTDFIAKSPIERFRIVKLNNRCVNCLSIGHKVTNCKSTTCRICKQKHHTLLHRDAASQSNALKSNTETNLNPTTKQTFESNFSNEAKIATSSIAKYATTFRGVAVLPTAIVRIELPNRKTKIARVLFDSASEVTLVSESFVKKHNIRCFKNDGISIVGITNNTVATNYSCELKLQSKFSNFELKVVADLIPKLPNIAQVNTLHKIQKGFTKLDFADTNLDHSTVDILIGVEYLERCFLSERKVDGDLTFRNTHFGWVISGRCQMGQENLPNKIHYCELTKLTTSTIENQLVKFWEVEQLPETASMNAEQQFCLDHFQKTISRNEDGRFVARLPYKIDPTSLGNSKDKAIRMLTKVERNMPEKIKSQYVDFIRHIHESYFHCNRTFLVNFVKSKFWILNGSNNVVKSTIFNCTFCKRFKAEATSQLTADLPNDRVKFTREFEFVGIDFAGPFNIRCTNHRTFKILKSYAAFFVCFVTRAVHIEIVSDLTTTKFIDALIRFIALRGSPSKIWTDNATNFQGARNLLVDHPDILNFLSSKNIVWQFITPRAPHHGGIWEAAIKAGKTLLMKATCNRTMSFEGYTTLFSMVAAILNSRPLDYRKTSNDNISVVTPSHFLHGSALLNVMFKDDPSSEPDLLNRSNFDTVKAYLVNRQIINTFWTEWRTHYLNELQIRHKWFTKTRNVTIEDVVIVKEEHVRPADWCLGLILETYPDDKGNVRSVKIRTNFGIKTRSINRVIVLVPLKHHVSA